jgi:hypothetical protein
MESSSRSKEWLVPLTGVLFILVLVASFIVTGDEPPGPDEGGQAIIDHYSDNKDSIQVGALMGAVAGIILGWFFSYVSKLVSVALGGRSMVPTVAVVGAGIVAVGAAIDNTLSFALADAADDLDPAAAQAIQGIWDSDFIPFLIGTSLTMLATGIGVVKSEVLPKWLGWIAVVIGIVAATPVGFFAASAAALWILVASIMLTVRARRGPAAPAPAAA